MCGIAGVVHPHEPVARAAVQRMNDVQTHRGPDDSGTALVHVGGRTLALGHRRLAIQDLSAAGHQPMVNPATGDVLVYNGELYNVSELRAELVAEGFRFASASDTEVLLAAFARWGVRCLERLYGMFAFGLYSPREKKLYVARDPIGIKPLYWAVSDGGALVFASELRAVVASGLIAARVDARGLESLLAYGAVASPRTMLEGVRLLEPGTWASADLAANAAPLRLNARRYWDFAATPRVERSIVRAGQLLRNVLRDSVRSHLVSDVPVAVFLSSGIDSTVIAALAAEARSGDIDMFTVRLSEDPSIDEAPVARRTAAALGARHHDVTLGESDALALATKWLSSIDQPSVDGLNTFVISRAARERGIVVALSGLGGDEMFGGYSTFRDIPLLIHAARCCQLSPVRFAVRLATRCMSDSDTRAEKLRDFVDSEPSVVALCLWRRRLMSNGQMEALGVGARKAQFFLPPESDPQYGVPRLSAWGAVRAMETRFYMGNMLLRDADVFGMAHGVEIRVPLLDRRVVDAALALAPGAEEWASRASKPWLVAGVDRSVRPEVLHRRKQGFSLPQARWMRGPLRDEFESRIDVVANSGFLDPVGVRAIWKQFLKTPEGPGWSRSWLLGALGEWLTRTSHEARNRARAHEAPAPA